MSQSLPPLPPSPVARASSDRSSAYIKGRPTPLSPMPKGGSFDDFCKSSSSFESPTVFSKHTIKTSQSLEDISKSSVLSPVKKTIDVASILVSPKAGCLAPLSSPRMAVAPVPTLPPIIESQPLTADISGAAPPPSAAAPIALSEVETPIVESSTTGAGSTVTVSKRVSFDPLIPSSPKAGHPVSLNRPTMEKPLAADISGAALPITPSSLQPEEPVSEDASAAPPPSTAAAPIALSTGAGNKDAILNRYPPMQGYWVVFPEGPALRDMLQPTPSSGAGAAPKPQQKCVSHPIPSHDSATPIALPKRKTSDAIATPPPSTAAAPIALSTGAGNKDAILNRYPPMQGYWVVFPEGPALGDMLQPAPPSGADAAPKSQLKCVTHPMPSRVSASRYLTPEYAQLQRDVEASERVSDFDLDS